MKIKSVGKKYSSILLIICLVASNCIQVRANDLVEYNYTSSQINETVAEDSKQTEELGETAVDDSNQTEKTNETATDDNEQTEEINETATEVNEQTEEMTETATEVNEQIEEPEKIEVPEAIAIENKELENILVPIVEIKEAQPLAIPQNLKASFEDGKVKIEWDSVEGALGYDLLINDTIISDIEKSPYYYCDISDESEYSVKIRAKFSEEEKAISAYLETKHVEMSNETASVNSLTDSIENGILGEWSSAVSVSAVASVGTRVSGNISVDTFWSAKNSPYIITGKMEIAQGASLSIEAGTVITMNKSSASNGEILIKGNLYASGTAGRPIVFTSINDPEYGGVKPTAWSGLHVYSTGELNLNYAEIRYAGGDAISSSGNLSISNSTISNSSGNGIYISTREMNVSIERNNIVDIGGTGYILTMLMEERFHSIKIRYQIAEKNQ